VSLQGATLREDKDDNALLYGKKLSTEEIVNSSMAPPPEGQRLIDMLTAHTPHENHK
jgi:lipid-binding SYLF domain-containing protein